MKRFLTLAKDQQSLAHALQEAIDIEMSTIPIYLYTYYSIIRTPNQDQIQADYTNKYIDEGLPAAIAAKTALEKSADVMVYANKAGATIMSVVIEEMLHMALASNLHRALIGMPDLVGISPTNWPTNLPGRFPELSISLAPFSAEQLEQFIQIESPGGVPNSNEIPDHWVSIGQFYQSILDYIEANIKPEDYEKYAGQPQLGPGNGYYTHNNVDTLYYNKYHKPQFTNADDSGDLVIIDSNAAARKAIETIVHQGEGTIADDHTTDDKMHDEESHYRKFVDLHAEFPNFADDVKYFVKPFPVNPKTAGYPADIQTVSNLLNAVYTYMYMMMESCYRNPMPQQSEIFNFGIHKGMVFMLSTLCDFITSLSLPDGNYAAPTFENYEFSPESTAKSQIIALYNAIPSSLNPPSSLPGRFATLPDMSSIAGEPVSF
ncbi:MAG: hypothetical protein F9K23_06810 [Bacteroidetes bacterium]|nr:MAG: hypothetical protein F9K23_06810 [Bacteroidota bacterium]